MRQYRIQYTIKGEDEPCTAWPTVLEAGILDEGELGRMVDDLQANGVWQDGVHRPVARAWVQYREVSLWTDIREDGTTQDG